MFFNNNLRAYRIALLGAAAALLAACGGGAGGGGLKGDATKGEALYAQCAGCHKLQENFTGPKHCGVVGRAAGTVPDFAYSEAMKGSGLTWDAKTLDEFLTSPISYVPGTMMGFAGFQNAQDRADVIAYLQRAGSDPATCPSN
jgi:cytochrome c